MNSEIICVGTEMLTGAILNTNVQYLSEELSELGINVHKHSTVGDNFERLKNTFKTALETNDIVLVNGGLGPTQDDLTKEAISEVLGRELIFNQELMDDLESIFKERGLELTENNIKQVYLPEDAVALDNPGGTAKGIYIQDNGKHIFLLPGPPREMQTVYRSVKDILQKLTRDSVTSRYYHLTGIGESIVEDRLMDIIDGQTNPTIATYAKPGEVLVRLTASGDHMEKIMDEKEKVIIERLGEHIFTFSRSRLAEVVGKYLIDHDLTISTAESCTGGLISSTLSSIPGISSSLLLGVTSYSNEAKVKVLGVKEETLKEYGAVSEQTCREMCENVRKILNSDIGVSVTGIAGPGGGTPEKPVGLVYTGIATKNGTRVIENHFTGSRQDIRERSMNMVFQMIRKEFFISY